MDLDDVRLVNALLAGCVGALLTWLALLRWRHISGPRRVLWCGCGAVMFALSYGSLEAVYLDTQIRVCVLTFGLTMLAVGVIAELREVLQAGRRR